MLASRICFTIFARAARQVAPIASAWSLSENGVSAGYGCLPLLGGPSPGFKLFVGYYAGARPSRLHLLSRRCRHSASRASGTLG
eukprot:658043-Rhodomonas_salina.1